MAKPHRRFSPCLAATLLLAVLHVPLTAAEDEQPAWPICGPAPSTGNYRQNSTYQANINLLSATLPRNASSSPALYATGNVGDVHDVVYGQALCRGDVTDDSACESCVVTAFRGAQRACPLYKDVMIFYDLCQLRFSNRNFLLDDDYIVTTYSLQQSRLVGTPAFDGAVGLLLNATADHAVEDSRRFGTGEVGFDDKRYPKIYALSQCAPDRSDRSPDVCRNCLNVIIGQLPESFSRRTGGGIFGVWCNFRYEVYPFFSGRPLVQLPQFVDRPPASAPPVTGGGGDTIAGSSSILMLLFAFWLGHKKYGSKRKSKETAKIESFLQKNGTIHPIRYTYAQVKVMTRCFGEKLGQGGFSAVYRGGLSNGCQVAVKMLKDYKTNGEDFINEVASISRTSHINVVTLLGFCLEGSKRALIYDYMPNGSLEKYAFKDDSKGGNTLGWEKLFDIAVGVARGLEYLHRGCTTRIVHFDIKPHNILLDQNFCPKISDFGLAKLCLNKESVISIGGARGTIGYIAPEVYSRQFGAVSSKSDVYSYGMMVLEMVGARDKNIISPNTESSSQYFPQWIYEHLDEYCVSASEINGETSEIVRKMLVVGLWCIQLSSTNRPTMTRVVEMLEGSTIGLELPSKVILS